MTTIESVVEDLGALADDISGGGGAHAASDVRRIDAIIKTLRERARELAAWRRKAQASLCVGAAAIDAERAAADAELRALGVDPNAMPAELDELASDVAVLAI